MKRLLHLKHWQLFLLMYGIPFTLQIIFISVLFATEDPAWMIVFFPLVLIVYIGIFFGWFHTIAESLYKIAPPEAGTSIKRFRIFIWIPLIYSLLIFVGMAYLYQTLSEGEILPERLIAGWGLVIFPIHLFSMFCIFYCMYFIAKNLRSIELQRPVTFNDYVGEFFLIWFFPVGVWFLQPRINKIFESEGTEVRTS